MRSLNAQLLTAIHAQETGEVLLPLVTLNEASLAAPIRIVPNYTPITHLGNDYLPLAFEVTLPDEEAEGVPVVQWTADNVDRRLVAALRQVSGVVSATIVWVLASDPDTVQIGPMDTEMRAAQYNARTINGTMGIEPILDAQFGSMEMNTKNAPGLF